MWLKLLLILQKEMIFLIVNNPFFFQPGQFAYEEC